MALAAQAWVLCPVQSPRVASVPPVLWLEDELKGEGSCSWERGAQGRPCRKVLFQQSPEGGERLLSCWTGQNSFCRGGGGVWERQLRPPGGGRTLPLPDFSLSICPSRSLPLPAPATLRRLRTRRETCPQYLVSPYPHRYILESALCSFSLKKLSKTLKYQRLL